MPRRIGGWLILAAVALIVISALVWGPGAPPPIGRGSRAPEFSLPRLDEAGPMTLAELRGKVVLLNFWATWCKPCEDEMPAMQRLYRALGSSEFELLAISVDDSPEPVSEFRERLGLTFPILLDPDKEVAADYQTFRFPESLLVDRNGIVVERYVGPKEWDASAYLARIRRLLEGEET